MSITIGKKQFKLTDIAAGGILLLLYFLRVSIFGMDLSLPFAFLWMMWMLNRLNRNLERQKETLSKIEAR